MNSRQRQAVLRSARMMIDQAQRMLELLDNEDDEAEVDEAEEESASRAVPADELELPAAPIDGEPEPEDDPDHHWLEPPLPAGTKEGRRDGYPSGPQDLRREEENRRRQKQGYAFTDLS